MRKKKLPYAEGDWFGVPLKNGGYAVGIIARSRRSGKALFSYFFGPRHWELPSMNDIRGLTPADAILIGKFGIWTSTPVNGPSSVTLTRGTETPGLCLL